MSRAHGPGRGGYVAAGVVFVLGVIAFAAILFFGLTGLSLQRVVVPGSGEIVLDDPGRYTIYHESRSTIDGRVYDVDDVAGLTVELVSAETGETILLEAPFGDTTYDFGGRSGRGVLGFEVDRAGAYRLSADYPAGGPETVLAVGGGIGKRIALTVVGAIAIAGGAFVLALGIGIITFVRRRRARRRDAPPAVGHTAAPGA